MCVGSKKHDASLEIVATSKKCCSLYNDKKLGTWKWIKKNEGCVWERKKGEARSSR